MLNLFQAEKRCIIPSDPYRSTDYSIRRIAKVKVTNCNSAFWTPYW